MIVRRLSNTLCHHGIKNQHWGVRNGPPYPLDRKLSRRIKAGHNENRYEGKKVGSQHSAGAWGTHYKTPTVKVKDSYYGYGAGGRWGYQPAQYRNVTDDEFKQMSKEEKDNYRITDLGLKEVNKFNTSDGGFRWDNILETGNARRIFEQNIPDKEQASDNDKGNLIETQLKRDINKYGFGHDEQSKKLLQKINNWDDGPDCQNNCSKCSDLVELVSRGINPDIYQAGRSRFGMSNQATQYHWDGSIPYKEKSYENIERRIKSFGNKGSGTIGIRRADGSGHSMHFKTVQGGRIEVQDGQNGRIYDNLVDALKAEHQDPNQFCHITRLDCATPNIKHMIEDSVLRGNPNKYTSGVQYSQDSLWINESNTMSNMHESGVFKEDYKRGGMYKN